MTDGTWSPARAAADQALDLASPLWGEIRDDAALATARDTAVAALRQAAALLAGESQRDPRVEISLGLLLCQRARLGQRDHDWDEAVAVLGGVIPALLSGPGADLGLAAAVAGDLGWALAERLDNQGQLAALDAAVHWLGTAVDLADAAAGHPEAVAESSWLNRRGLAGALRERFVATGSRGDIERAIAQLRAVLTAVPAGAPGTAELWRELVELYFCRTASMADDQDIDDLIETGLEALDQMPARSPERADVTAITGLVMANATHRASGGPRLSQATDTAIGLLREARTELPPDSTWRPSVIRETGAILAGRGETEADLADLREGIALLTEAVGLFADDDPVWAETAGALGNALVQGAYLGLPTADLDLAISLLTGPAAEGIGDPARHGSWLDSAGLAFGLRARRDGRPGDVDRGIDCHARALRAYPGSHPGHARATSNLALALLARYRQRGDLSDLDAAIGHLDGLIARLDPGSPQWRDAQLARGECLMSGPPRTQDRAETDQTIALSRELAGELPARHPLRPQYLHNLVTALLLRFGRDQDAADARDAAELAISMVESLPGDHPDRAALFTSAAVAVWAGGRLAGLADPRARSVAYLTEAVQATRPDHPERGRRLAALGIAILTPPGHPASEPLPMPPPGLTARERDDALAYLDEAAGLLTRIPGGRMTASVLLTLARLRRARDDPGQDDRARSRQAGLAALAEHAAGVFLQSATPNALARAQEAAADAAEVATWCLADDAAGEAVVALESGRGLVLQAAAAAVGVAESLRGVGQDSLAGEWSRAADEGVDDPGLTLAAVLGPDYVPPVLRQRVLAVLTRGRLPAGPLAPPTLPEVTRALAAGGHDALVYLLPALAGTPGAVVVVRPSGAITALARPGLDTTPGSPVGRYARAHAGYRTRHQGGLAHELQMTRSWDAALRDVLSWAGTAVIEDLLTVVGPRPGSTPPRLVLVPFGVLGMVPWHAALVRTDDARGPALGHAVFSYAASARQLGEAVARTRQPWRRAPAFVVNPLLDLPWASAEVRAIRAAYCPDAPVLGYLSEDQASVVTPADVLALLPGPAAAGASLLHVSCHGRAAGSPLDSALLLTAGQELTVERILRQARTRPAGSPAGLVVLAACLSDLTDDDHDEALTLATTFLSAGAASVIGSQWEISDVRTALLMVMTYEFLQAHDARPADALRAAQLWMLDPGRAVPPGLPAELAAEAGRPGLDDPAAWAAFVHHGW